MKIYLIINTDELRISQILPLDENEIRKNWLAVEIPEMIEKGVVTYKEKSAQ